MIKSVSHDVPITLYFWAQPTVDTECPTYPFKYSLSEFEFVGPTNGIMFSTADLSIRSPAGIDLMASAIETLEEAKRKAKEDYLDAVAALDKKLDSLRMLAAPSDDNVVSIQSPAVIPADDIPF